MENTVTDIQTHSPEEALREMMSNNIHEAKLIYELSKLNGWLDSQEFMDWQDELNAISVMYK